MLKDFKCNKTRIESQCFLKIYFVIEKEKKTDFNANKKFKVKLVETKTS